MTNLPSWDELKRGVGCPLCALRPSYNEYVFLVRKLRVSTLYLTRGQTYRGSCGLVADLKHVVYISELEREQWALLAQDLWDAVHAVLKAFAPDHINVERLGNTVPHLHWGLIPRYKNDRRWGHPIWTTERSEMKHTR